MEGRDQPQETSQKLRLVYHAERAARRWRNFAFLAFFLAIVMVGSAITLSTKPGLVGGKAFDEDHIGLIQMDGVILSSALWIERLERMVQDDHVRGIIVEINSPGGTLAASEALLRAIERARESKPLVAVIDAVGASGAYLAALGSERIFSGETSTIGSVGVYFRWYEGEELLQKIGLRERQVQSGPLKGTPRLASDTSSEAVAALESNVEDAFDWFVTELQLSRSLSPSTLATVTKGGTFIGRRALDMGLVDAIGQRRSASRWIIDHYSLDDNLGIEVWAPTPEDWIDGLFSVALSRVLGPIGVSPGAFGEAQRAEGLLALWEVN